MRFRSTRGGEAGADLQTALRRGLAADGGLYVPQQLPTLDSGRFADLRLAAVAERLLQPFFDGSALEAALPRICRQALDFPVPAVAVAEQAWVLELFHGPTAAFKDVGARFLAACLDALGSAGERRTVVLTATSGDTGAAVAAAFEHSQHAAAAVLFPSDGVSPRQRHQLTCWKPPITSFAVAADFDRCQALVKAAFQDPALRDALALTSANSISIGRLLPQMSYYAATALALSRQTAQPPGFIIPTGNLGNALACVWARAMGLPIGDIVLATNANQTIPRYLDTGDWRPEAPIATLASAMDVAVPSNMERLRDLFPGLEALSSEVSARSVSDAEIRHTISEAWKTHGRMLDPHTATAWHAWQELTGARRQQPWVIVATAHPAKFEQIVEPLIGQVVPVPESLQRLLARPTHETPLAPELGAVRRALLGLKVES